MDWKQNHTNTYADHKLTNHLKYNVALSTASFQKYCISRYSLVKYAKNELKPKAG